jgi:hypothetical protein
MSCSHKKGDIKEEQIRISTTEEPDSAINSVQGNIPLDKVATDPNSVVLTGLQQHRLVTIYKKRNDDKESGRSFGYSKSYYGDDENGASSYEHFMPGLDVIYGYNLLNLGHYDFKLEKLNLLFDHPVLIKTIYYPSYNQDSLNNKPINRTYYLISVYDTDTNKDTIINNKDLRRFYYFGADGLSKIQLIPSDYSVIRSEYDPKNDVMYIFAYYDENKNGVGEKKEPLHIFWINLKDPRIAKRLY